MKNLEKKIKNNISNCTFYLVAIVDLSIFFLGKNYKISKKKKKVKIIFCSFDPVSDAGFFIYFFSWNSKIERKYKKS